MSQCRVIKMHEIIVFNVAFRFSFALSRLTIPVPTVPNELQKNLRNYSFYYPLFYVRYILLQASYPLLQGSYNLAIMYSEPAVLCTRSAFLCSRPGILWSSLPIFCLRTAKCHLFYCCQLSSASQGQCPSALGHLPSAPCQLSSAAVSHHLLQVRYPLLQVIYPKLWVSSHLLKVNNHILQISRKLKISGSFNCISDY